MTIPKLQDGDNPKIKNQVQNQLSMAENMAKILKGSSTYLVFGKRDEENRELKSKFVDILFKDCGNIFPEELQIQHETCKDKKSEDFLDKMVEYKEKMKKVKLGKRLLSKRTLE